MKRYAARLKMLADAQSQTTKEKRLPTSFATEAKRIDQGRASDYWATRTRWLRERSSPTSRIVSRIVAERAIS